MVIRQVTVPWMPGYDIGIGADLASGSPMAKVVVGEATPVEHAGGATVDFQVQRIQSTEELERALAIDVEASYGCAAFGAGASGRFSFAKNSKIQSSSLFLTVMVHIELAFLSIDGPVLSSDAAAVVNRPDVFEGRYGNMFVRGLGRGGLFVGVMQVDTGSSEESEKIATELEGAYGLFSADAQVKFDEVRRKYRNEVHVHVYHEGGPTDLGINDVQNPLELLNNANKFLESFQTRPDEVARPYFATLAPVTVALGPLPLNAAQVQHAQDVLVHCAKRRSALLDQLNLVEFVLDHLSAFDFGNGADPGAFREADLAIQGDLDLIAECASTCINDASAAKMPAEYAKAVGKEFPRAHLPDRMPLPKAGNNVVVPSWNSEEHARHGGTISFGNPIHEEYIPSAQEVGLLLRIVRVPTQSQGDGGGIVVSQNPASGTLVSVGTTITLEISE